MSCSVQVLAPNGRRQTVKCTPNTTVLQILQEVCKKQNFEAAEYDVKHHNKILDTTLTFRYSGLPNNAQLELVSAAKTRVESEVTVALNLEDGTRLMGSFVPDDTLRTVLVNLGADPGDNPLVVYMRNEIRSDRIASTKLRDLGLTGGRAMLRLVNRAPEEMNQQANVSAPLPVVKPMVEEKPFRPPVQSSNNVQSQKAVVVKPKEDLVKMAKEKRKAGASPTRVVEKAQPPKTRPKIEYPPPLLPPPVDESLDDFIFLGERNAMLFSLDTANFSHEDLPDDFFDLTIDDAKKILHDIRRNRDGLENGVLMTAAMRQLDESKRQLRQLNRYKQSIIRVQFPDRTILQGTFKPTESIRDVMNFVCDYLDLDATTPYLYTTPPKCVLSEASSLVEVGCVPGALLHLGNDSGVLHLKAQYRDKFTTNSKASLAASKMRKVGTRNVTPDDDRMEVQESIEDVNAPGPSSQPTSCERKEALKATDNSPSKVPKWFKPMK